MCQLCWLAGMIWIPEAEWKFQSFWTLLVPVWLAPVAVTLTKGHTSTLARSFRILFELKAEVLTPAQATSRTLGMERQLQLGLWCYRDVGLWNSVQLKDGAETSCSNHEYMLGELQASRRRERACKSLPGKCETLHEPSCRRVTLISQGMCYSVWWDYPLRSILEWSGEGWGLWSRWQHGWWG